MNNTQKDRFEKKLIRFIRELDTEWNRYRKQNNIIMTFDMWEKHRDKVYKKYGFTDEEWNKASRLIRSKSWAGKRLEQKKILRDKNRDIYRSDIADNPNGEAEIKAEDRWIADVFDTYDYDKEDMSR
jgi:hypothetical protein